MNKAIDRCPVFLDQNQVFRGKPSGRIENAQDKSTLVDDNRTCLESSKVSMEATSETSFHSFIITKFRCKSVEIL
jgi:hypothetical protein